MDAVCELGPQTLLVLSRDDVFRQAIALRLTDEGGVGSDPEPVERSLGVKRSIPLSSLFTVMRAILVLLYSVSNEPGCARAPRKEVTSINEIAGRPYFNARGSARLLPWPASLPTGRQRTRG